MKKLPPHKTRIFVMLGLLVAVNILSYHFFERFDLTADQRYTLSPATIEILKKAQDPVVIQVFLEGDFPTEFRRLQQETRYLLEEIAAENTNIIFRFTDPLEDVPDARAVATQFYSMGMTPARVNVALNGRTSESIIFPWAMASQGKETVKIPLLRNQLGAEMEQRVENSVQQLEYAFADGLSKLLEPREKKIAVMRGNGELSEAYLADLLKSLSEYYYLAPFTLDSVAKDPQGTLAQLSEFDLVIEAKPTEAFTEKEKYVLDQYLMQGGKMLWMVEHVSMENDSLLSSGNAFALPRELNLGDYFFKYGLRVNPTLVRDLYSAPIILASGRGNETRFNPFPWFYFPLGSSPGTHPIVENLEAVRFEYANPIDTLPNDLEQTVLLSSSTTTQIQGLPVEIRLDLVNKQPDPKMFRDGPQPLAVLVEGTFPSVYKNRIKPFELGSGRDLSLPTQFLLISDGDVARNQLQEGKPLELGFDRYTRMTYGNKEFLINSVNYLLDDTGLINIRTKEIAIAFLDPEKVARQDGFWRTLNLILPVVLLVLFAVLFHYTRRRKYLKK